MNADAKNTAMPAGEPWAWLTEANIDEYLSDYEMRGEDEDGRDACHTPTEGERFLIKDAIMGLLTEAQEATRAVLALRPSPDAISVQEAWEAAGGNPGIKATKAELLDALRMLDKVCDEAPAAAASDILAERKRQISVEGWTPEHDDEHNDGSLSVAAACYALTNVRCARPGALSPNYLATWLGWGAGWFKPTNRRRDLIKAGALILAEIERLDRAAAHQRGQEPA